MLNHLNFHPLEVVSRYRDPQLQVGKNYSHYFVYFETKHLKIFDVTLILFSNKLETTIGNCHA